MDFAALGMDGSTLVIWLSVVLVAGLAAGILAGLLGVGGGIIIVPVLYQLFTTMNIDPDVRMHVAVATSLSTIIVTSLSSVRSHHKRGAVDFPLLRSWAPSVFVGVVLGTILAGFLKGWVLTAIFATVALIVALRMVFRREGNAVFNDFPNQPVKIGLGGVVGLISTMMGIGGGTLSVPFLTFFGYDMRRAVGTAAAMGFVIAVPGTIGYIILGWGEPNLPPLSLGYVNVLCTALLIPCTVIAAPWGARIAHAIPQRALQLCFAFFLFITSAKMIWDLIQLLS
ncbi:sulfite exporter TauE/SafE family protein [Devosia sp.]|uniref:sulfite exporter TauE/SafE family protein n=1 Tax=Devosia sp. TaxID=1871048 RepID=UPI003A90E652